MEEQEIFDESIKRALLEDIGSGDITSLATIPEGLNAEGKIRVKEAGIIAGLEIAGRVFRYIDRDILLENPVEDGDPVFPGSIVALIRGSAVSILMAERTALNFLQRMSGIATYVHKLAALIRHTEARILDTRKTAPGLRYFDKLAVRIGGGKNHRHGLYDMFLIKDNHLAVSGSVAGAVELCRNYNLNKNTDFKIEIETENLSQVEDALRAGADIIMLDNFTVDQMKQAVLIAGGKAQLEASGGIDASNIKEVAETGVNFISIGAITHSVKALDISLDLSV